MKEAQDRLMMQFVSVVLRLRVLLTDILLGRGPHGQMKEYT
jgi:hypothetical protein